MTVRIAAATCAVLAALAGVRAGVVQKPLEHVRQDLLIEYRQAVQLYRSGSLEDALALLRKRKVQEWQRLVDAILRDLEIQAKTNDPLHLLDPRPYAGELAHNTALARSAAALHMEAALDAYARRESTPFEQLARHVMVAEWLFAFAATQDGRPSAAREWELVLGLIAAADGESGWAIRILDAACRSFPDDGALQLARGAAYESTALLPVSQLASGPIVVVTGGIALWENALTVGRTARDRRRAGARDALERAVATLRGSAEARIRLAHVRFLEGDADAASRLLGDVVLDGGATASRRDAYLSRLLLGRVRQKQGRLDEAGALYEQAATIVPSAQSALAGLADLARTRGDAEATARATERMLAAPRDEGDPWARYRFAQYWLRDDLLARLRSEARQ